MNAIRESHDSMAAGDFVEGKPTPPMHLNKFDMNLLVALDTLLSECNVTRAADRLCVSQPAMSNALQRIRDYFGDPILVRSGREMQLTALAETLIAPVRDLILQAEAILKGDSHFEPATAKRALRIAMSDYCGSIFGGALMRLLSAEAPGIKLEIYPLSFDVLDDLIAGRIDMCITAQDLRLLAPEVDTALFGRRKVFVDSFVCAVDRDNREVGDVLDLETYTRLPHAVMRLGGHALSLEEQSTRRLGLDLEIAAVAPIFTSLPMLLPGTPLVITIQKRLCERLANAVPMRVFAPPVPILGLEETLFWHNRADHDRAHAWLRDAVCRAAIPLA